MENKLIKWYICINCGATHFTNPLGCTVCGSVNIFVKNDSQKVIPNKLILVTGGTGSGKNWIVKNLDGLFKNIPSVTDRLKRELEVPGVDYKFISTSDFEKLEDLEVLIESVKFGNNLYGVESKELLDKLYNESTGGILIVEPGGLIQVLLWLINHLHCIKGLEIDQVFLDISRAVRYNNILGELVANGGEYLDAQETALTRIIRNGDSIPEDYKNKQDKIEQAIDELRSHGITVSRHNLENKNDMQQYVDSFKTTEIDKMIEALVTKNQSLDLSFEDLINKLIYKIEKLHTIRGN